MSYDDELREIYALASKALSCQMELGHSEIIIEAGNGRHDATDALIGDMAVRMQADLDKSETATEVAPQTRQKLELNRPKPEDKEIPDYGPLPVAKDEPSLMDALGPKDRPPEFENLDEHNTAICDCTKCPLGHTRTNFVYGVGNPEAKIMFIGEAPGRDEDLQGEPFVGRAGKLLDKIIEAMGFKREEVYIANILKCRPPNNRDPQPDEMNACFPYLKEQIRLIKPQFIVALGRIAAQGLLDTATPLGKLRQQWHTYEGIPLLVTYHPAALLRFQQYKRPTWEDMQVVMKEYERINRDK